MAATTKKSSGSPEIRRFVPALIVAFLVLLPGLPVAKGFFLPNLADPFGLGATIRLGLLLTSPLRGQAIDVTSADTISTVGDFALSPGGQTLILALTRGKRDLRNQPVQKIIAGDSNPNVVEEDFLSEAECLLRMACSVGVADLSLDKSDDPEMNALRDSRIIFTNNQQQEQKTPLFQSMYVAFAAGKATGSEKFCQDQFLCPVSGREVATAFARKYETVVQKF